MPTTEQLDAALSGRYTIDRLIGEGGMATVYLARDIRHNRRVALKVLKPDLGAIVGVERFLAEIEVTANLQHPNLLPLFDSGATDGLLYYVMPYVEGESLRARLDREKQLPVDDAVRLASAIASALDYAHRHNVIHRDLKPENILLHDGQPLVADFGIALAVSNAGGNRITQTGLSLGTPLYMSPEQATGDRTIDARTDVYSLGAVTYEMLTGEPPHIGNTSQAIIARVLTERPRSTRSGRPSVPEHVDAAVLHALEKLPADRFASAREFSEALSGSRSAVASPTQATAQRNSQVTIDLVPAPSKRARVLPLVPWTIAIVATATAAVLARPSREPALVSGQFLIPLPDSLSPGAGPGASKAAISRDGTMLLVVGRGPGQTSSGLYLRRIEDPTAQRIRGTDSAMTAGFSPNGEWLIFTTPTQLRKVPVVGGTPTVITDSAFSPHWGDQDRILFTRRNTLWLVTGAGSPRIVAGPDSAKGILAVAHAELLPGGDHALVSIRKGAMIMDSSYLAVVSIGDGSLTKLGVAGSNPRYAAPGHIVFGRVGGQLYAAPFSLRKRAITGEPTLLLQDVSQRTGGPTDFGVSANGSLVFLRGSSLTNARRSMVIVDRNGIERTLKPSPEYYTDPRVSPDGRRVSFDFRDGGLTQQLRGDVFVDDLATGARTRITSNGGSVRAEWSRDGVNIIYVDQHTDSSFIVSRAWDRASGDVILARGTTSGAALNTVSVGPQGGWSAFRIGDNLGNPDIWIAPTDSLNARRPFITSSYGESGETVSPDGRLLAYASSETGRDEIYIVQMPVPGARIPVSIGGGTEPAWSRDGKQLFFRGPTRMMVATIADRPTPNVVRIDSLFVDRYFREKWARQYDVMPDGRLLMIAEQSPTAVAPQSNLFLITNWQQMAGMRHGDNTGR